MFPRKFRLLILRYDRKVVELNHSGAFQTGKFQRIAKFAKFCARTIWRKSLIHEMGENKFSRNISKRRSRKLLQKISTFQVITSGCRLAFDVKGPTCEKLAFIYYREKVPNFNLKMLFSSKNGQKSGDGGGTFGSGHMWKYGGTYGKWWNFQTHPLPNIGPKVPSYFLLKIYHIFRWPPQCQMIYFVSISDFCGSLKFITHILTPYCSIMGIRLLTPEIFRNFFCELYWEMAKNREKGEN